MKCSIIPLVVPFMGFPEYKGLRRNFRLRGYAGWSVLLLFVSNKIRLSCNEAHKMLKVYVHAF